MIQGPSRATVQGYNAAFCALAALLALLFMSPAFAGAIVLGTVLGAANLRALWRHSEHVFFQTEGPRAPVALAFVFRFLLLGAALWLALSAGVNAIGVLIGLSILVPSIVIAAWRKRPPIMEGLPAMPADDPDWDLWNPWMAREGTPGEDD